MTRVRLLIAVAVAIPVVGVLIGLVTGPASGEQHWPGWFEFMRVHPWPSLIVLTVVAVGLASLATLKPQEQMSLLAAADQLADAVARDWSYEAQWRKVFDPYPLPVEWLPADPDLVVTWPTLTKLAASRPGGATGDVSWATGPASLADDGSGLADVLGRIPTGRLVVLGEKGAGKTILLLRLVLELLRRRKPGDPVPILLPLASWNPQEQDLQTWMVSWLITDRAGLGGLTKRGKRVSLARALVEDGRIMPVLDGLDEIPETVRGAAITRINDWMKPDQGLVLAARTEDYRTVVHPTDGIDVALAGAAGIELRPLAVNVVASYLKDSAGGTAGESRWDSIIAAFDTEPPPSVADILTTPLMAFLARVTYNPRPGEDLAALHLHPDELLDAARFPDKKAIEDYLYDHFIPASYRQHLDPEHPSRKYRWTSEQSQRWLVFLAQHQEYRQGGSTDIAWWRLPTAAPGRLVGAALGILVGLVVGFGYPFVGFGLGMAMGIVIGLIVRCWGRPGREGLAYGLAGGLLGGLIGGLLALPFFAPTSVALIARLLSGGLAIGISMSVMVRFIPALIGAIVGSVTVGLYENYHTFAGIRSGIGNAYHLTNALSAFVLTLLFVELAGKKIPSRGIRWSGLWFGCGLISSLVLAYITWIQIDLAAGLTVGLAALAASALASGVAESVATDVAGAASPGTVLGRDRTAFIVSWLGLGVSLGAAVGFADSLGFNVTGHTNGFEFGAQLGLTQLLATGLIFGFIQATWGPFVVTRCYLAASRRLPWRLMSFLRDAHSNRGVLRQVGAVYQFRHIELQRRLATVPTKVASGLDYCPFGLDSNIENQNLKAVSFSTAYGLLVARVSDERLSNTATMYIHGVGADWTTWKPMLKAATELNLPVHDQIFIDLPGFGDSENKLDSLPIDSVGDTLLELATSLGYMHVRLVGHSMGGFLALDMASRRPDRVHSIYILAGSYFSVLHSIQHPIKSLMVSPRVASVFGLQRLIARTGQVGYNALWLLWKLGMFRLLLWPFAAHPFRLQSSVVRELAHQQNARGMTLTAVNGVNYEAMLRWSRITCPIVSLYGDRDNIVPRSDMQDLHECQPTAVCNVIQYSGHLLHIERPFAVVRALDLWSQ